MRTLDHREERGGVRTLDHREERGGVHTLDHRRKSIVWGGVSLVLLGTRLRGHYGRGGVV